ncbi:MAG TPA: hypothetical protein VFL83_15175 [Anaeromyxobacter sp.]|nr:hypothetical protein [Anaeromyxobacter sp.]
MTLQERINTLEAEARGRIRRALATGNEKLMELDGALAKVARDDWTVPGMRRQLHDLRARAENLGASTLKKVEALPGEAMTKLATNTRTPVQSLAKGLAEWAKRMEPPRPKAVEVKAEAKAEAKVAKAS